MFDAEGRFACRAVMPALDDVFEFGKDYLLAHHGDSLGVERVLQFPLGAPATTK